MRRLLQNSGLNGPKQCHIPFMIAPAGAGGKCRFSHAHFAADDRERENLPQYQADSAHGTVRKIIMPPKFGQAAVTLLWEKVIVASRPGPPMSGFLSPPAPRAWRAGPVGQSSAYGSIPKTFRAGSSPALFLFRDEIWISPISESKRAPRRSSAPASKRRRSARRPRADRCRRLRHSAPAR